MSLDEETRIVVEALEARDIDDVDVGLVRLLVYKHTTVWAYTKYLAVLDGVDRDLAVHSLPLFGDTVRITLDDHRIEGMLIGDDENEVTIQSGGGVFTVSRAKILSVEILEKNRTVRDNLDYAIHNIEVPEEDEDDD